MESRGKHYMTEYLAGLNTELILGPNLLRKRPGKFFGETGYDTAFTGLLIAGKRTRCQCNT